MWGWRSGRTVAVATAAAAFVVVCILPPAFMVSAIVTADAAGATLRSALLDSRQRSLLATTIALGSGAAVFATAIGAALGLVLARLDVPLKAAARIALAAPAVLPSYVVALAWTSLAGERAFTIGGAIVVLTTVFYPIAMLATEAGLRRVDPRLEEAALLVARPARVLWRISGRLVMPNLLGAALMIFVLAISDFSVAGVLRVRVFTTEVFSAFAALYDAGRATVLSLPLLVVSTVVAGSAAIAAGRRLVARTRPVHGTRPEMFEGWESIGAAAVAGVVVLTLVVPIAALAAEALGAASIGPAVWASREAAVNSVILAAVGATAATALAFCLGQARARIARAPGAAIDVGWVVLFTIPSTVVGIGLIGVWNRSATAAVYGTPAMLVLGYLARFVPAAALAVAAAVRAVPVSHEEAAAAGGAGWLRTMTFITFPQVRLSLAGVWIVVFILAFGEVGTSILVAPAGESTLPIRVYTMTANAPPGHVAALALFQSIVILVPLSALGLALARRGPA